jgi:hypothetical protein
LSAWSDAFSEVFDAVQPADNPTLTYGDGITPDPTKELDKSIINTARGKLWASGLAVNYGDTIFPTVRMGHAFKVIVGGSLGTTEPTWLTSDGATVTSGSVTLAESGTDSSSIYDTRAAKYDALNKKVMKSVPKNQTISDGRGQANSYLYLNLVRERDKHIAVGVS